jgi:hypothetical protein
METWSQKNGKVHVAIDLVGGVVQNETENDHPSVGTTRSGVSLFDKYNVSFSHNTWKN